MPGDAPGSLGDDAVVDILTFDADRAAALALHPEE